MSLWPSDVNIVLLESLACSMRCLIGRRLRVVKTDISIRSSRLVNRRELRYRIEQKLLAVESLPFFCC